MPSFLVASWPLPSRRRPRQGPALAPVRVLIVTGVDHPAHDWKANRARLERTAPAGQACVVAKIVADPDVLATNDVFNV